MMTGTIKTITDKGFGFIAREGEAKDLASPSRAMNPNPLSVMVLIVPVII